MLIKEQMVEIPNGKLILSDNKTEMDIKNKKALLIIDMQNGCFTTETPKFDADNIIERINALSKIFRESNFPVIFIQQDSSKWNRFIPDSVEWKILSDLKVSRKDILINKIANDAFYQSSLDSCLKEFNVNELLIMGFATEFCVEATIQSGLAKDYDITVIKNGHTTGDKPHLKAEKIIEQYNWVWQNMIPTKGKIKVLDFKEIEITNR